MIITHIFLKSIFLSRMVFALRRLNTTKIPRVIYSASQKFHTSKTLLNEDGKGEVKSDVKIDTAMTFRRKSKAPLTSEEYLPVFEFSKAGFFRLCGGFIGFQTLFWTGDIVYITQFSSDLSLAIPVMGLGISALAFNAINKYAKSTVTEVRPTSFVYFLSS